MDLKEKLQILLNKMNAGQYDEVIFESMYVSKKYPKEEVFINLVSLCYQAKGEYQKSVEFLETEINKGRKNFSFLNNLGLSYLKLKNIQKAEEAFLNVLKINPRFINTLNNLGILYAEINDFKTSEKYLRKSLEINSDVLETNYNLATTLQGCGKLDEAKSFYQKTLKINKNFTRSDLALAMIEKNTEKNNNVVKLEEKVNDKNINISDKRFLSFALGKIYEDLKQYEKSYNFYKKANELKKQLTKYDIENDKSLFQKIIDFHKSKKLRKINSDNHSKKIIFILGMPRTGTSVTEQIISSHSEVFGAGELSLLSNNFLKYFNSDFKDQNIKNLFEMYKINYLNFLEKMSNLKIITDKTPLNFRWIGIIKCLFPNSLIIHCTRDPFENSWSIYKNEFEQGMFFSNNFKDIAGYYKLYNNMMKIWNHEFKDDIFELKYEDLISNPNKKIKDLIHFCQLSWDDKCLEFYKNKRSIKTVSFLQARKPIYKDSLKGSKNFDKYLLDLKAAFND